MERDKGSKISRAELLKQRYGEDFFSDIAKKGMAKRQQDLGDQGFKELMSQHGRAGGQTMANNPEKLSENGRKGGVANRLKFTNDPDHFKELGRQGGLQAAKNRADRKASNQTSS
jgi:general stress protein YciG